MIYWLTDWLRLAIRWGCGGNSSSWCSKPSRATPSIQQYLASPTHPWGPGHLVRQASLASPTLHNFLHLSWHPFLRHNTLSHSPLSPHPLLSPANPSSGAAEADGQAFTELRLLRIALALEAAVAWSGVFAVIYNVLSSSRQHIPHADSQQYLAQG